MPVAQLPTCCERGGLAPSRPSGPVLRSDERTAEPRLKGLRVLAPRKAEDIHLAAAIAKAVPARAQREAPRRKAGSSRSCGRCTGKRAAPPGAASPHRSSPCSVRPCGNPRRRLQKMSAARAQPRPAGRGARPSQERAGGVGSVGSRIRTKREHTFSQGWGKPAR